MLTPILVQPDQDMQFWIETDASRYATGAVLSQLCKDDKCHPVGFKSEASQTLRETTRSMTKSSYQSSEVWKKWSTSWKELPEWPQDLTILLDIPKSESLASRLVPISGWVHLSLIHRPGWHSAKLGCPHTMGRSSDQGRGRPWSSDAIGW